MPLSFFGTTQAVCIHVGVTVALLSSSQNVAVNIDFSQVDDLFVLLKSCRGGELVQLEGRVCNPGHRGTNPCCNPFPHCV